MAASDQNKGPKRQLSGIARWLVFTVAVGLACFHLYTAAFGVMSPLYQRSIHLMGLMLLTFMIYRAISGRGGANPGIIDWIVSLGMIAVRSFSSSPLSPRRCWSGASWGPPIWRSGWAGCW